MEVRQSLSLYLSLLAYRAGNYSCFQVHYNIASEFVLSNSIV